MRLIVMRHGRAEDAGPDGDLARGLTDEGRTDVRSSGGALLETGYRPDVILVSSASRSLETVDVLPEELKDGATVEQRSELYNTDLDGLLDIVGAASNDQTIMIVGHNPGLGALFAHLNGDASKGFKPADIGVFEVEAPDWRTARPLGRFGPKR